MARTAVLLNTHQYTERVRYVHERLKAETDTSEYDVFLLTNDYQHTGGVYYNSKEDVKNLGYVYLPNMRGIYYGCCNYPVLNFYKRHPEYDRYWLVEYDVEYTGWWNEFFTDFDTNLTEYDFLSSHVERYGSDNRKWDWWSFFNYMDVPKEKSVKSFNTICRYSNRALRFLDEKYRQHKIAHSEVFVATTLYRAGFKIGDFGGSGEFVPEGYENKYYQRGKSVNSGTNRYRPVYEKDEITQPKTLYHPLKSIKMM